MPLTIDTLVTGPMAVNTYLLRCDDVCVVVDPGGMVNDPLLAFLQRNQITPQAIWLTHGHGDHIAGVAALKDAFPTVQLICPEADAPMLNEPQWNLSASFGLSVVAPQPDRLIRPGDSLTVGTARWQVLDTSGHTPGGVSHYCSAESAVLTGDALFAGSIGRTDVPGADGRKLLQTIRDALLPLPDETNVLPGHGPGSPLGRARQGNPIL